MATEFEYIIYGRLIIEQKFEYMVESRRGFLHVENDRDLFFSIFL